MKAVQLIASVILPGLILAGDALAVTTSRVYSSSIFVILFLSFCALVVVIQLIPAIMTLFGMMKAAGNKSAKEPEKVEAGE